MKKVIKDNKGYMLVEIIVASVIALVMAYLLMDMTIKLVNKSNDYYVDTVLVTDKNIITKEIMDDINNKKLLKVTKNNDAQVTLSYDDGIEKHLIINKNTSTISYGDYKKKLSKKVSLGDIVIDVSEENNKGVLIISIPAYTNYSKEDYGIKIAVPYSENIEITYPRPNADLTVTNITVDNKSSSKFPTVGSYTVDVNCNTATATFDYESWKLKVSNVSLERNANCSPKFTTTTKTKLSDYIIGLLKGANSVDFGADYVYDNVKYQYGTLNKVNTTITSTIESTDYRYHGLNPNNYIRFNGELWRIIGVFDEYSHGQSGQHLVKIIRDESIGSFVWDKDRINNWPTSSIYKILNNGYYNSLNVTNEDYCYAYNYNDVSIKGKCDFTAIGLKEPYKSMIVNATWYLGGFNWDSVRKYELYKYERLALSGNEIEGVTVTDNKCIDGSGEEEYRYCLNGRILSSQGYVGLMYGSDYAYSTYSSCNRRVRDYSDWDADDDTVPDCANRIWLKKGQFEWTITHSTYGYWDFPNVFYASDGDLRDDGDSSEGASVRPVVYLNSSVYYLSGDGTISNPYIVGR